MLVDESVVKEAMSQIEKLVPHWLCVPCGFTWIARNPATRPKQCPSCWRRGWDRPVPARLAVPLPVWRPPLAKIISKAEVRRREDIATAHAALAQFDQGCAR